MKKIYLYPFLQSSMLAVLIILGLSFSFSLKAQNIGNWNLNATLAGTGTAFNTVGNISLGSGVTSGVFNGGTEYYGENGWPAGALNTNAYLEFGLTPVSGYMLNISTLNLRMRRSNTGSPAGSGPTAWAIRSSVDGFTSDLSTGTITHNYANYIVTLPAFTYLTSTVTFRIYGYTTTISSGGISRLVFDNISVQGANGTLPVHFSLFNARKTETGVELKWTAMNISAGTKFDIERSSNGIDFIVLHQLEEATDKANAQYTFNDHSMPAGKSFYRIRATEPSGIAYRTAIIAIGNKAISSVTVDKVMVRDAAIYTSLQAPTKGVYTVSLVSINGAVLLKQQVNLEGGMNSISIPVPNLSHGPLVLSLYGTSGVSSKKFMY